MRNKILATIGIQKIEQYDNVSMKKHWDIVMFFNELSVMEDLGYKVELEALESVEVRIKFYFSTNSISFRTVSSEELISQNSSSPNMLKAG